MLREKGAVGVHTAGGFHYLDHLAPLCAGLNIPLLITEIDHYNKAKAYYPGVDAQLVDSSILTADFLAKHYNLLLYSNFWKRETFSAYFQEAESRYNKKMRSLYCPHGNSDKGLHYYWMEHFAEEDLVFLYGQRMIDFLTEKSVFTSIKHYVMTGNYRYSYYLEHRSFYDDLMQKLLFNRLEPSKKTILYAPTWNPEDSSFLNACELILKGLPEEYQLLVKLHPNLEDIYLGYILRLQDHYAKKSNVIFISDLPLVYPLLAYVDLYIGDASSVGYDFLAFDRPLFFLNEQKDRLQKPYLFCCGIEIPFHDYGQIYQIIDSSLKTEDLSSRRQEIFRYTFGTPRFFNQIAEDVCTLLDQKDS